MACRIHRAERAAGLRTLLFGSLLEIPYGLAAVFRHTPAVEVSLAALELGITFVG